MINFWFYLIIGFAHSRKRCEFVKIFLYFKILDGGFGDSRKRKRVDHQEEQQAADGPAPHLWVLTFYLKKFVWPFVFDLYSTLNKISFHNDYLRQK